MHTSHPDIVVMSPDGEYLMVVGVHLDDHLPHRQNAIEQLTHLMASMGCSTGLVVIGEHMTILRDFLEKAGGESIAIVGEAALPKYLLPAADGQWQGQSDLEFESRVQQWLEQIKQAPNLEFLPDDLKALFNGRIINLLRLGEVRAAGPRWRRVIR
ncbi:MAG: hypothetical protein MH825_10270 [Cyanobacteria bacterium]|nr:hypothetical protein [Cyanobacteriota bacterium]